MGTTVDFLLPEDHKAIEVEAIELDSYCQARGFEKIHVVKIDIEGGEAAALDGMSGGLERHFYRRILLEIHPQALRRINRTPVELVEGILRNGDQCWQIFPRKGTFSVYSLRNRFVLVKRTSTLADFDKISHFLFLAPGEELKLRDVFPSLT